MRCGSLDRTSIWECVRLQSTQPEKKIIDDDDGSVVTNPDQLALAAELMMVPVPKLRDTLTAPKGASKEALEEMALASEKVQRSLDGAEIRKVIVVPDRLVNIVT